MDSRLRRFELPQTPKSIARLGLFLAVAVLVVAGGLPSQVAAQEKALLTETPSVLPEPSKQDTIVARLVATLMPR